MKRLGLVLALLLMFALALPVVATAAEPFTLWPPSEEGVVPTAPIDTPLCLEAGWVAGNRGLALSAPTFNDFYFKITRVSDNVVVGEAPISESKLHWLPGVTQDPSWIGGIVAFNPRIGAKIYAKRWLAPVEGLTAGGLYHVVAGGIQTRKANDLLLALVDPTVQPPLPPQHSVIILPAGPWQIEWDFIVQ